MKVAIIGSGVSGLVTALLLKEKFEVEVFEKETRLGGHAHTVTVKDSLNNSLPVDTGFLVYNDLTYPHFIKLLEYLKVETTASDMSLSIQTHHGLEWAGTNLNSVFAQRRNIINPRFLVMLKDILKFNKNAEKNLELSIKNNWTLQQLIQHNKLSTNFINWYLLPMTGAIWSMSYKKSLEFPASTFMQFCINHRLLQVENRPQWKTIKNGSVNYVNAIKKQIPTIHSNSEVISLSKKNNQLELSTSTGLCKSFDKVVFATSVPIAHQLLSKNFTGIANQLKNCTTSKNIISLHQDISVMPKKSICWSSWNVKAESTEISQRPIELTYYLNKLQPLATCDNFFITLNHQNNLKNEIFKTEYQHPLYDNSLIELQKKLTEIQGQDSIYFAGAWTRYGFHEDGVLSAVQVAQKLEVETPWKI